MTQSTDMKVHGGADGGRNHGGALERPGGTRKMTDCGGDGGGGHQRGAEEPR